MASITLKDIPPRLHRALKLRATGNRRSLQSEIIITLEEAVRPRPVAAEEVLERARRFRETVRIRTNDEEMRRFKRQGRV